MVHCVIHHSAPHTEHTEQTTVQGPRSESTPSTRTTGGGGRGGGVVEAKRESR